MGVGERSQSSASKTTSSPSDSGQNETHLRALEGVGGGEGHREPSGEPRSWGVPGGECLRQLLTMVVLVVRRGGRVTAGLAAAYAEGGVCAVPCVGRQIGQRR